MKPVPKDAVGDHELVPVFNRIYQNLRDRTPLISAECDIDFIPGVGFRIKPKSSVAGGSNEINQYQVQAVHRDHLECKIATYRTEDGGWDLTSDTVRIAKPEAIRMRGWDTTGLGIVGIDGYHYTYIAGGTNADNAQNPFVERTATLIDGNEFGANEIAWPEQVWPKYIEGRTIIYASKVKQTPIFPVTETTLSVATTYNIDLVDLNVDGRTFQPKFRKVKVCVEGSTGPWFVLIRASSSFQEE